MEKVCIQLFSLQLSVNSRARAGGELDGLLTTSMQNTSKSLPQDSISLTNSEKNIQVGQNGVGPVVSWLLSEIWTREPELSSVQFDANLVDFSRLKPTEAARCEECVTEDEIRLMLKTVGTDKTPTIDGLPYEVYLRLSHMFFYL